MTLDLQAVYDVIVDIKPSLSGHAFAEDQSLRDLGLDSLDIVQLGRKLQRLTGTSFVARDWLEDQLSEGGPLTIAALVDAVQTA